VILSISHGDCGDNGYLGKGGYLSIGRACTGGRKGLEGGMGGGKGVRHGVSRVLSPWCVLRCSSVIVEEGAILRVGKG
jgi:hypothetical protein